MSIRKFSFVEGEYYHIYNRGNDKRIIFHDKKDYRYFLQLLYLANRENNINISYTIKVKKGGIFVEEKRKQIVSVGAYTLMPNHFHLLITEKQKGGISKFMQKVSTGYAMYYNNRYERSGSLFQGKFKAEHLGSDTYLKYIFSYIHLNPVKLIDKTWKEKGIKNLKKTFEFLRNYSYSSLYDYLGVDRSEKIILSKEDFPKYFLGKGEWLKEIVSWLKYK